MNERVKVFSLGGTIASVGPNGSGIGVAPKLTAEDLVAGIPQLKKVAKISTTTFRQIPGVELTIRDLIELASEIRREIEQGVKGVVITQGTDTIEETAFVLDCLLNIETPVIVTGAMRNPDLPGADGAANILAAVQTAASDVSRGLGTLVVFNDEIHAAQFVRKTHTSSTATFRSPLTGPIGWISEGRPRIVLQPRHHWHVDIPIDAPDRAVALIKLGLQDDGILLDAIEGLDYQGIVIEALGGGHVRSAMVESLERIAKIKPVILASRIGTGELLQQTYSFPGSERDLLGRGLISAGMLDGLKARLLLMQLLMRGANSEEIRAAFNVD